MKSTGQLHPTGRTTTRSQLQEDINAIFHGFHAQPEDTLWACGNLVVQPNPVLRDVQVQANAGINVPSVLPERVVDEIFREQYGSIPTCVVFSQASNA